MEKHRGKGARAMGMGVELATSADLHGAPTTTRGGAPRPQGGQGARARLVRGQGAPSPEGGPTQGGGRPCGATSRGPRRPSCSRRWPSARRAREGRQMREGRYRASRRARQRREPPTARTTSRRAGRRVRRHRVPSTLRAYPPAMMLRRRPLLDGVEHPTAAWGRAGGEGDGSAPRAHRRRGRLHEGPGGGGGVPRGRSMSRKGAPDKRAPRASSGRSSAILRGGDWSGCPSGSSGRGWTPTSGGTATGRSRSRSAGGDGGVQEGHGLRRHGRGLGPEKRPRSRTRGMCGSATVPVQAAGSTRGMRKLRRKFLSTTRASMLVFVSAPSSVYAGVAERQTRWLQVPVGVTPVEVQILSPAPFDMQRPIQSNWPFLLH